MYINIQVNIKISIKIPKHLECLAPVNISQALLCKSLSLVFGACNVT